jgi:hypothetical protein
MNTEFALEWKGFTGPERQNLKTRWSRLQFPPEFCASFSGRVDKGAPGDSGSILIRPNDLRTFTEHFSSEVDFSTIDELVAQVADFVLRYYVTVQRVTSEQKH